MFHLILHIFGIETEEKKHYNIENVDTTTF